MGEAAEDVLDGSCCQGCGEWFDDVTEDAEPPGYPRFCGSCEYAAELVDEFDDIDKELP